MYFALKYFCHRYRVIQRQGTIIIKSGLLSSIQKKRNVVPKDEVIVKHISLSLAGPVDMWESCWHIWIVVSLSSRHT